MTHNGPLNVPFTPPYAVWTQTDNPEWIKKNGGVPLVLLVASMGERAAQSLAERLADPKVYGDANVEIWDARNRIVWSASNPDLIGTSGNWRDRAEAIAAETDTDS